ncbi:hypothetical protein ANN_14055 [Periplaneta americana]|uniref:Uncharacterized protein n=1 Tax=Periplaneta americana TaxID=6978 RepID=A0ABQ8SV86_PERAM|nr:hypothetical protein ANN_14055 [Periplaneta americana]
MAVDIGHIRQHICLTRGQAIKGNIEGGEFDSVLWIEFGVAQWSERLVRRTKDPVGTAVREDAGKMQMAGQRKKLLRHLPPVQVRDGCLLLLQLFRTQERITDLLAHYSALQRSHLEFPVRTEGKCTQTPIAGLKHST